MSSGKCKNCGGTEIDVDPARGDAVCTNCGTVLESSAIVSEVQFEDTAHGGSSAIGQFVSSDSRGGARGFGGSFNYGIGKESREITLQNTRKSIANLGQQLRLNQHCIDTAFNFYKMALTRNLTRGRKSALVVAACVYMTCRTEGTAHLLIDCSDVLQINVYELGRTYLKLSQALCINIPSMDPCLYILRFANRLEFGERTHEVSMTALRLVQRMKKDSIHSGRRPSGLCGAALLMAARLHDFSRSIEDIIKIVKVHESTLRKRLLEFGETPSSCLTLDEFMTVDLEEEQDPPCFKAARIKDRERLQKVIDDEKTPTNFNELQLEIDKVLNMNRSSTVVRKRKAANSEPSNPEVMDADRFAEESMLGVIQDCCGGESSGIDPPTQATDLGPNIASFKLGESVNASMEFPVAGSSKPAVPVSGELDLDGIDDDEISSYLMTEKEVSYKGTLWNKINAEYIKAQKEKEEKLEREKEEGKPEKKRKRTGTKKNKNLSGNTAGEAINKMLQEKRISSKINYDVLKDLNVKDLSLDIPLLPVPQPVFQTPTRPASTPGRIRTQRLSVDEVEHGMKPRKVRPVQPKLEAGGRRVRGALTTSAAAAFPLTEPEPTPAQPDVDDEDDFEEEPDSSHTEMSLTQMLNSHGHDAEEFYDDY